jgi:hypothetical protein
VSQDKPVALWSVPRSISTAFERVFVERDDFEVFHEPFGESYYYSEERLSDRYSDEETRPEDNYENVLARLLEPHEKRVFVKDMAYQAKPLIGPEFVSRFRNTFIVRDPKYVIASLSRMWPDFTLEETGFEQLYRLFRYATEAEDVVVVDSMTFSENPVGVLAAYCEAPGDPLPQRVPLLAAGGGSRVGELGKLARGSATEYRHQTGRAQGPGAAAGASRGVRKLPTLLLPARGQSHPGHGTDTTSVEERPPANPVLNSPGEIQPKLATNRTGEQPC